MRGAMNKCHMTRPDPAFTKSSKSAITYLCFRAARSSMDTMCKASILAE